VQEEEQSAQLLVELLGEGPGGAFELASATLALGGADLGDPAVLQSPENGQQAGE
jgi:hypothetical protein